MFAEGVAAVLDLLYPPCCAVCRAPSFCSDSSSALCSGCAVQIVPVSDPCPRCGHARDGRSCRLCRRTKPAFDGALALGAHDGVLKAAIHRFKYRDRPALAEPLGRLLADHAHSAINDEWGLIDALVPVPMHPARRRVRGYNQSERLAHVLSRELSLPIECSLLIRPRPTRAQVGLTGDARRANLSGAFAVPRPDAIRGKTFLLVDDVSTTGTTLSEGAQVLKAHGADAIYCLVLAAG